MKNSNLYLSILALIILAAGCASGPRYSALHSSEPPLAAGNGRIYMYRTTSLGAAVQPAIKLNEEDVGSSVAKGYFFVDRPAGSYQISATTEVKRTLSLTLDPGQERYVRFNVSMGFFVGHVWPELVVNQKAEREIADCHFTGK